jgi:hypothetical protein
MNLKYKNYKYAKPSFNDPEMGFLTELPLDGVKKIVVPFKI